MISTTANETGNERRYQLLIGTYKTLLNLFRVFIVKCNNYSFTCIGGAVFSNLSDMHQIEHCIPHFHCNVI